MMQNERISERHPMQQKLLLTLLITSRKLHHYLHGHPIKVISAYSLEQVLSSPNAAGRVAEWNIGLQAFQLEFYTTGVIKGAALANIMAEWIEPYEEEPRENKSLLPRDELCFRHDEKVSNNIAEYEGLIPGLRVAFALGIKRLSMNCDSQLLVNSSNKKYKPKDKHMAAYLEEVRKLEKRLLGLELQHIPRGVNMEADDIAKHASRR
ncbi:uncharacterized protein [Aegilops tauschii subsp. strangulata]|uniref:uncharacterized protein n=1 Tax=Aegilops tauschii subsp. strangulata TaxID=200361 RepID=UPI003CC8DCA0